MATIDKRRGKWRAQVRRDGHSLCRTFHLKADAEAWARQAERTIDLGGDPTTKSIKSKDTYADLVDLHIADLREVGRSIGRSKAAVLRRLKLEFGHLKANQVTRERLIEFGRRRAAEGAGPATLSQDLSFFGTVLTHAAAIHGLNVHTETVTLARVALRRLGLVGRGKERDRRPTEDELTALFAYFDGRKRATIPMSRIIKFAIASAMRMDEICRIERTTVDARSRTVLVTDRKDPREKQGNDQRVPLLSATGFDAWAILQDELALHPTLKRCFPYRARSLSIAFTRACQKLQIVDLHFHDMRHEATSRLFEGGLTIEQVPLVTGHKDWKMLKRYTQLRPEMLFTKLQKV